MRRYVMNKTQLEKEVNKHKMGIPELRCVDIKIYLGADDGLDETFDADYIEHIRDELETSYAIAYGEKNAIVFHSSRAFESPAILEGTIIHELLHLAEEYPGRIGYSNAGIWPDLDGLNHGAVIKEMLSVLEEMVVELIVLERIDPEYFEEYNASRSGHPGMIKLQNQLGEELGANKLNDLQVAFNDLHEQLLNKIEFLRENPVNVNHCNKEELMSVPGIGLGLAVRIIEGRPYSDGDDLLKVKGIGEMKQLDIIPRLVFDD